jgi:hypothetical protein
VTRNEEILSDSENYNPKKGTFKKNKKETSIDFYTYDFGDLLKGSAGKKFVKFISRQPITSPMLENKTVHAFLDA